MRFRLPLSIAKELSGGFKALEITGYTDSIGAESYNIDLSQRRANATKKILVDKFHLSENKIKTAGLGPANPIADNGNYQGRRKND